MLFRKLVNHLFTSSNEAQHCIPDNNHLFTSSNEAQHCIPDNQIIPATNPDNDHVHYKYKKK